MGWRYRASREILDGGNEWFCVREVFYTKSGKRWGWTENAVKPSGDTKQELIEDLEMMLEDVKSSNAFTLPTKAANPDRASATSGEPPTEAQASTKKEEPDDAK